MPDSLKDIERRAYPRFVFAIHIPIVAKKVENSTYTGEMVDISESGAKIRFKNSGTAIQWKILETLDIDATLTSGHKISFQGEIRWANLFPEGYLVGIHFTKEIPRLLIALAKMDEF